MKIVVTTPTGQIGSRVVERLLETEAEVVVLARDPGRLAEPVRRRAEVRQGTLEDGGFVAEALRGADALFALVPPNYGAEDWAAWLLLVGENLANAVRAAGIPRVVLLSSAGAHRADLGAISRLGEIEGLLQAAAPNVFSLRAGFFMENLLGSLESIRQSGAFYMAIGNDVPVPFVATSDLGDAAARLLLDDGWSGHIVRAMYGPEDLTLPAAAEVLAREAGVPVSYVAVPAHAAREALLQMGASADVATVYAAMFQKLSELRFEREPREGALIGGTTLAEWSREVFAPALGPVGAA
jgi:uncharacterized protein YbjT (DUF2867 family)